MLKTTRRLITALLLLIMIFSFSSCGRKTPLFFRDRADSNMHQVFF